MIHISPPSNTSARTQDGEQTMPEQSCCSKRDLPTDSITLSLRKPRHVQIPCVDGLRLCANSMSCGLKSKQVWEDHSPNHSLNHLSGALTQVEVGEGPEAPNVWCYHPWQGVCKEDQMDVDVAMLATIAAEEKQKLLKEGRCFNCKKLGHVSCNCPTKTDKNAPNTNCGNHGMTTRTTEITNSDNEMDLMEQIRNLTMEERSTLMDEMVLKGF